MTAPSADATRPFHWSDRPRSDQHRDEPRRGSTAAEAARTSYYGVPVIHKPHWKWLIVVYFFLGGIAGACYVIATVSHLFGPAADRRIIRAGRYLSLAALVPCPFLLIFDLGRPERFLNMLRVLKFRSPMSVGTWGLTVFGAFSTLSALIQLTEDGLLVRRAPARLLARLPARLIGASGTPFAFFVSGYTGVLLAATAVPLWTKRAHWLGPLFLSSALSNAASAIALALKLTPGTHPATIHRLERLERLALASELSLLLAWLIRLGRTARPLRAGRTGALVRYGTIGSGLLAPILLPSLATRLPGRTGHIVSLLSPIMVLAGGFILRYAVVVGGHASVDDPQATFDMTRAHHQEKAPLSQPWERGAGYPLGGG